MIKITKTSLFFLLITTTMPTWALVPPDYQEPPSDFTAEVEAGFQLNTGNTDSTSFNARTQAEYDTENAKQEGLFKAYFASDDHETTAEKYELQLQSNYKLDDSYIFGRGEFILDDFGSYTEIYTVSAGYGFDAIDLNKTSLSLEIGPGYRYNLPISTDEAPNPSSEKDIILRTAARFEQEFHEYTTLSADLTSEVGQENSTITLDVGYKNTIFQDWAFKVGFNIKYTDDVPEGSDKTDTITTFNLLYTFH